LPTPPGPETTTMSDLLTNATLLSIVQLVSW
jgi:cation transporter-like permease